MQPYTDRLVLTGLMTIRSNLSAKHFIFQYPTHKGHSSIFPTEFWSFSHPFLLRGKEDIFCRRRGGGERETAHAGVDIAARQPSDIWWGILDSKVNNKKPEKAHPMNLPHISRTSIRVIRAGRQSVSSAASMTSSRVIVSKWSQSNVVIIMTIKSACLVVQIQSLQCPASSQSHRAASLRSPENAFATSTALWWLVGRVVFTLTNQLSIE